MVLENQADPESIIGGTELDENVWKTSRRYLAALVGTNSDGLLLGHSCTATLISRRVVLTAGRELEKYRWLILPTLVHFSVLLFPPQSSLMLIFCPTSCMYFSSWNIRSSSRLCF